MSHKRGGHRSHKPRVGEKAREVLESIDDNSPIIKMFKEFSVCLDEKHDRYERIVKLSRDITIESKRIIFLLHNRETDIESKREKIFNDAHQRLQQLVDKQFRAIAVELEGRDSYQYLRAYTSGMQEFIEALVFLQFQKGGDIENWGVINDMFMYQIDKLAEGDDEGVENVTASREVKLLFPQVEFILGIADFTGELMRKCINNLGAGNVDDCFKICEFVRYILSGFLGVNSTGCKEISRKLYVLKQSLAKMELVCYNIRVRGSEIPKDMLAIVATGTCVDDVGDDDEGFY